MTARWHPLGSEKESKEDDPEEDDNGNAEEEEEEGNDEEENEEADFNGGEGEESDQDATHVSTDHRIDIGDREGSFWDDDDDDDNSARLRRLPVPPHLADDHSIIDVLASEIRQQAIPSYMDQFEVVIPDAELLVGAVPLEDVQQREREIEEAAIRRKQLDVEMFRQRETRLLQRETQIRDELKREAERKHKELAQRKLQFAETMQLRTRRLTYVFQQAESHLKGVLRRQQARVSEVFGQLEHSQIPAERRKYRVEWEQIPVTLKIRAKMLRALKDKLPAGQYVLLATLYDRLGGHALHWTAWDPENDHKDGKQRRRRRKRPPGETTTPLIGGQPVSDTDGDTELRRADRPNVTQPFHHRGRFYNTDVAINQNVFVVCPPESHLRPGNVLVFELFLLDSGRRSSRRLSAQSSSHQLHDQIVAWGALPLMTPEFGYVEGKFKIPLLRGEMDATMDKYRDIEDMYTQDLSAWLCNLYLHVAPMKDEMERLIFNQSGGFTSDEGRYDVEIDQRNAVYRLAGGGLDEDPSSEHLRIRRKSHALSSHASDQGSSSNRLTSQTAKMREGDEGGGSTSATILIDEAGEKSREAARKAPGMLGFWSKSSKVKKKKSNRVYAGSVVTPQLHDETEDLSGEGKVSYNDPPKSIDKLPRQPSHPGSQSPRGRGSHSQRRLLPNQVSEIQAEAAGDEDDAGPLDIENYHFAVNSSFARESAQHMRFHTARKLRYLRHELFVDLGVSRHNLFKMEFWLLLLMFVFALWLRVYVHYVSQWLFLKANRVPVFYFRPQWTTCMVKYTWRTIATHTEIGVLVVGVLGNWAFFASLAGTAAVSQAYIGELPAFGSKFLVCIGIATLLDPYLTLLVDLMNHQYDCASRSDCLASLTSQTCRCVDGDAFKLYTRFLVQEGSGLVGILLTAIVYAALTCLSLVAFYMYLLHVHMNGRMLDVYRRIHAQESDLFLPHDCEISLQELKAICEQASRWKGPRGMQRKVFVHEYVLEDPLDPSFQEKSTHIALYTISLEESGSSGAGSRELYRHFLKSHDGAIIELFGQVGTNHDGSWQQDASPGMVSSLALLYNILQDQYQPHTVSLEATASDLAQLFAEEPGMSATGFGIFQYQYP